MGPGGRIEVRRLGPVRLREQMREARVAGDHIVAGACERALCRRQVIYQAVEVDEEKGSTTEWALVVGTKAATMVLIFDPVRKGLTSGERRTQVAEIVELLVKARVREAVKTWPRCKERDLGAGGRLYAVGQCSIRPTLLLFSISHLPTQERLGATERRHVRDHMSREIRAGIIAMLPMVEERWGEEVAKVARVGIGGLN